jgi:pimeloyl-ACP methyl ester carboxylesterase
MNFLETKLLRIGYEAGGPADGPRVLLLHGWPDMDTEAVGVQNPWIRGTARFETESVARSNCRCPQ